MGFRQVGAVALCLVTVVAGTACSHRAPSPQTPPSPFGAATHPIGQPVTVDVDPNSPFELQVPGVGTIAGGRGAVTAKGTLVAQPIGATFSDATLQPAGNGVDVSFNSTSLAEPLTVTFAGGAADPHFAPVVAHRADDGHWELKAASADGAGHIVVQTQTFSINVPALLDPVAWFRALGNRLASLIAGRTSPIPNCPSNPPSWAIVTKNSSMVHICPTTNVDASSGAVRVEIQLKSNRGIPQEVDVPGVPDYVWVKEQPWSVRKYMLGPFQLDPNQVVILPAGGTMTIGYRQPNDNVTYPVATVVSLLSTLFATLSALLTLTGELAADSLGLAIPYLVAKCVGMDLAKGALDLRIPSFLDGLKCTLERAIDNLGDPTRAAGVARDLVGNTAENLSISEATAMLTKVGARAIEFKWMVMLWPFMQVGWGGFVDAVEQSLVGIGNTNVSVQLQRAATTGGGGGGGGLQSGGGGNPPSNSTVSLTQGPATPSGYRYSVTLNGFAGNTAVSVICRDSVSPGGFFTFTLHTDANGHAATANSCYSGDGPDHWVTANGIPSNHVTWSSQPTGPSYFEIRNSANGRCLDADSWTISNQDTKLQLWDCNGDSRQQWYRDGSTIRNRANGHCLDADTHTLDQTDTAVHLWPCTGEGQQNWQTAGGTIVNGANGHCLDADTHTLAQNGTIVHLWPCIRTNNQAWSGW